MGWEASIMRRTLAKTLTAGLLLLGCTAAEDDDLLDVRATEEPAPEPTEDPEPEPEPEPDDPYAVPDEIDEAYVELVINAILEVQSEVLRGALAQEQGENLAPDLVALHFATTEGSQRSDGMEYLQEYIDDPSSRGFLRAPGQLGRMTFKLDELIHAEAERCLIAIGQWDLSAVTTAPDDSGERVTFSLSRIDENSEVSGGNPTPWQWRDNRTLVDTDGAAIDREYWSDLDFEGVLDHTCEEL
jgi:hypothetical protein